VLEQAEQMDEDIWLIGQITEMIELSKLRVEKKVKKHISILIKAKNFGITEFIIKNNFNLKINLQYLSTYTSVQSRTRRICIWTSHAWLELVRWTSGNFS
jgi:hypothetical protein